MTAFDWLLISLWSFAALATIARIDKPQKPISHGVAVVVVALEAALIVGLLWTRGALA